MTGEEHKWIETNNSVCALLRQAHDVLAISSLPPRRTWVGLTDEEYTHITDTVFHTGQGLVAYYKAIEAKLKELNT